MSSALINVCEGAVVALICQQFANFEKLITQFKVVESGNCDHLKKLITHFKIKNVFKISISFLFLKKGADTPTYFEISQSGLTWVSDMTGLRIYKLFTWLWICVPAGMHFNFMNWIAFVLRNGVCLSVSVDACIYTWTFMLPDRNLNELMIDCLWLLFLYQWIGFFSVRHLWTDGSC